MHRKKIIFLLVLALLIFCLGIWLWLNPGQYEYAKTLLGTENLKNQIEAFGIFAPLVFMFLYMVLLLLFVSSAALTVLAGLLFGKLWGSVYVVIAATLAAQIGFTITRYLGAEKVHEWKDKQGIGKLIKTLEDRCQKNGFQNLLILRCLFLPFMPLSYAAGMIKTIKPRDFFFATLLTNMVFSPAFVFLGDSLLDGPKALILPITMIVIVLSVPKIVKLFQK